MSAKWITMLLSISGGNGIEHSDTWMVQQDTKIYQQQTMTAIFSCGAHNTGSVITGTVAEWGEAGDGFDETVCSLKRTGINHQSAATHRSGSGWSSARRWGVQALIRKMPDDGRGGGLLRDRFINCKLFTCQSSYQLISRAGTIWIILSGMTTHRSRRIGLFFTS